MLKTEVQPKKTNQRGRPPKSAKENNIIIPVETHYWVDEKPAQQTAVVKNVKNRSKNIRYELFLNLSNYPGLDEQWKTVFNNMYIGKNPIPGISYNEKDSKISFRSGTNKTSTLDLAGSLEEIKDSIISFIKSNGGLFSKEDLNRSLENNRKFQESNAITKFDWSLCQKKTKELFKIYFIDDMAKEYSLSETSKKKLSCLINNAIVTKKFVNKNFVFDNSIARLSKIEGLQYNPEKKEFELSENLRNQIVPQNRTKKSNSRKTKIEETQYFSKWKDFCNKYYSGKRHFGNSEEDETCIESTINESCY